MVRIWSGALHCSNDCSNTVHHVTAYGLIASGELRSVKIGRSRRVPADALEEYVAKLVDAQPNDAA